MDWARLRVVATTLLTAAILGILFWFVDVEEVPRALLAANPWYLAASIVVVGAMLLVKAHRWTVTASVFGHSVPLSRSLFVDMATYPAVGVTPSRSGELLKIYYFEELPGKITTAIIVLVRTLDLLLVGLFGAMGVVIHVYRGESPGWAVVLGLAIATSLLMGVLVTIGRGPLGRFLERKWPAISASLHTALRRRVKIGQVVTESGVLFLLSVIQAIFIFAAVGIHLPPVVSFTAIPAAIFVGLLPITVGGMGTRDTAFVVLLSSYGNAEQLLAGGILFSALRYWLLAVVGLPFMQHEGRR